MGFVNDAIEAKVPYTPQDFKSSRFCLSHVFIQRYIIILNDLSCNVFLFFKLLMS